MNRPLLLDKVYGCLIAGAIGDAMGAPVEMYNYEEIRDRFGRVTELLPNSRWNTGPDYGVAGTEPAPPGRITDDCTYRHYICKAIIERNGRITPEELGSVWVRHMNTKRLWLNELIVHTKLRIGMNPWDSGRGTSPTGCAAMAISPIGIWRRLLPQVWQRHSALAQPRLTSLKICDR
ncbi:MAG: hypothetical protein EA383_06760 [Spirochaetaceae bacterium]|nr:MAG: hypothetical protein EA383_06760 [Spirochaetaceae bacterium]